MGRFTNQNSIAGFNTTEKNLVVTHFNISNISSIWQVEMTNESTVPRYVGEDQRKWNVYENKQLRA
jgi:hypothetical protein